MSIKKKTTTVHCFQDVVVRRFSYKNWPLDLTDEYFKIQVLRRDVSVCLYVCSHVESI